MATATGNYVCDNSSLANFKSWGQAISNAFAAFGWSQTADTGQVVWSSIASVPSSAYVYEVWKSADSLSTSLPIYVKVYYGFSSTSPRIQIQTGTGSNGSGTLTGNLSALVSLTQLNTNQGATTYPCYFSGDSGSFRMYMWQSTAILSGVMFGIERSVNSSGVYTADYFTLFTANSSTVTAGATQQTFLSAGSQSLPDKGMLCVSSTNGSGTGALNGTVASFPAFPVFGKVGNPFLSYMAVCASDVSDGSTVTVASMYGSTHTFKALVSTQLGYYAGTRNFNGTPMAILMRYE